MFWFLQEFCADIDMPDTNLINKILKIEMKIISTIRNALKVKKSLKSREAKNKQIYFICGLITSLRILRMTTTGSYR